MQGERGRRSARLICDLEEVPGEGHEEKVRASKESSGEDSDMLEKTRIHEDEREFTHDTPPPSPSNARPSPGCAPVPFSPSASAPPKQPFGQVESWLKGLSDVQIPPCPRTGYRAWWRDHPRRPRGLDVHYDPDEVEDRDRLSLPMCGVELCGVRRGGVEGLLGVVEVAKELTEEVCEGVEEGIGSSLYGIRRKIGEAREALRGAPENVSRSLSPDRRRTRHWVHQTAGWYGAPEDQRHVENDYRRDDFGRARERKHRGMVA